MSDSKLEQALKLLGDYFEDLSKKIDSINLSVKSSADYKQAVELHARFERLADEYQQLVVLNNQVLQKKKNLSDNVHASLMTVLAKIQSLQTMHGLQVNQEYVNITQNALSTVTDWKLGLDDNN